MSFPPGSRGACRRTGCGPAPTRCSSWSTASTATCWRRRRRSTSSPCLPARASSTPTGCRTWLPTPRVSTCSGWPKRPSTASRDRWRGCWRGFVPKEKQSRRWSRSSPANCRPLRPWPGPGAAAWPPSSRHAASGKHARRPTGARWTGIRTPTGKPSSHAWARWTGWPRGARRAIPGWHSRGCCWRSPSAARPACWPVPMLEVPASLSLFYGGTFDPFHCGHLTIARHARDRLGATVRVMPAADPPHRPAPGATALHRARMLELALDAEPGMEVDLRELARATPSWTVETLREVRSELGERHPVALLVGADSLYGLPDWKEWRALFALAHFVVAARPGTALDAALPPVL